MLETQAASRVPALVPIRYGRMAVSPFAFFRGAALVDGRRPRPHAADCGLVAQLCGDAHLSNFGGFASPERQLVFDINDFDETLPGPFEWDVKRLAPSLEVAAGTAASPTRTAQTHRPGRVAAYRRAMAQFAGMNDLEVWYARADEAAIQSSAPRRQCRPQAWSSGPHRQGADQGQPRGAAR